MWTCSKLHSQYTSITSSRKAAIPTNDTFQIPFRRVLTQPAQGQHSENGSIRTGSWLFLLDVWSCRWMGRQKNVGLPSPRESSHVIVMSDFLLKLDM